MLTREARKESHIRVANVRMFREAKSSDLPCYNIRAFVYTYIQRMNPLFCDTQEKKFFLLRPINFYVLFWQRQT